ncbi:MAG: GMC family oxidoreductase [Gemmatimonadetes bacterium]|nr:GMC family oxidoreductase [Gemmatimonadota bacterium]
MSDQPRAVQYRTTDVVDFVIVGSGAAGGVLAKELSTRGHSVVVLEQGPRLGEKEFGHGEIKYWMNGELHSKSPYTWRQKPTEEAKTGQGFLLYATLVGGSSVHMTANFWRFRPVDFKERSLLGAISGTGFADWPITYDELEPYYTKVDWEVGVSGVPEPGSPRRSRPYPMPPVPVKSAGVLLERAAKKLGYKPFPAPMAILSREHNGRLPCQHCGFCMGHGCEYGAKSSSLASMIPVAERTGRCEIRANCAVRDVELDAKGRATGVVYFDKDKKEQRQRAKAVILACNGAETPRLLLTATSKLFPNGLANSSGLVGKYLMFNGGATLRGEYEHPLNEYKSVEVTRLLLDWYDSDPKRGFYGGGGIDSRFDAALPVQFALNTPQGMRGWGADYKKWLAHAFTRNMELFSHTTSLPVETNSITLDPKLKDAFGRPAIRVTYADHADDIKIMRYLWDRSKELHDAAGAKRTWGNPPGVQSGTAHLLGTARMGNDPKASVVDKFHRTHDVKNLFICDGSSLVTSGRGQPTMTIMALAFRAGEKISEFAKRGEV